MFSQKLLLPAFALLSVTTAQSAVASACKAGATTTINSQGDVAQIASCSTIAGTVVIGKSTTNIALDGPEAISGSLIVDGAVNLTDLTSTSIGSIGTWEMSGLTILNNLRFDSIETVGTIKWVGLQGISGLTFAKTITKAKSVTISNTYLTDLAGINLKTVDTLDVDNNLRLKTFSSQLVNITTGVSIFANGQALSVTFPNLETAGNMTFRNVSTLSIPSLESVTGSLIFDECGITGIMAQNLTSVGTGKIGDLAFIGNPKLANVTIPNLTSIAGGLHIANNTALQTISFADLATVGGAVDLSGNFTTPEFPAITDVAGAFNVQSTSQISCSAFDKLKDASQIEGQYACVPATKDPENLSPSGTVSGGTTKPSKSKSAAVSYGLNEAVAGLSVVGGIMQMLL